MTDSQLAHDVIAEPNEFVYFHDFATHAARFGFACLAEAAPVMMGGAGLSANMRAYLSRLERIAREQYIDFARLRRFRQSLLVRADAPCHFDLQLSRMHSLFAMASMPLLQAAREGRLPGGAEESSLSTRRRMLERLVAVAPASVPVSDLLLNVGETDGAAPAKTAEATLFDAWMSGFVQFRTTRLHLARTASDRVEAFALARWQATTGTAVTNLRHETIRLSDSFARELLTLLDGSRDREELTRALASRGSFGDTSAVAKRVQGGIDLLAEFGLLIR
ncbi:MAG TPA: methyltransferase regulatory domain-containing protein [Casimicrobiaceae bacterium]|nr:methyltransferase regulatory domain-containing protein [Casimicrobiaceae bacterium]